MAESNETAQPRGHTLVIEPDTAYAERFPDFPTEYRWRVECANTARCDGWQECPDSHEVSGQPTNDGPWDSDESAPWHEEDYFTFHGVEHEWRSGYGWTVPFEGCVVWENAAATGECPISPMRPGRWEIKDEWDDEFVSLIVVRELTTPPGQADPS